MQVWARIGQLMVIVLLMYVYVWGVLYFLNVGVANAPEEYNADEGRYFIECRYERIYEGYPLLPDPKWLSGAPMEHCEQAAEVNDDVSGRIEVVGGHDGGRLHDLRRIAGTEGSMRDRTGGASGGSVADAYRLVRGESRVEGQVSATKRVYSHRHATTSYLTGGTC